MRSLIRMLLQLAASVALFLVVRAFVVEMYKIPSASMQGTLLVGDFLVVDKMVYGARVPFTHWRLPAIRAPHRGDVVVFDAPPEPGKFYVKRVVGIPGDTLTMTDGTLYRDRVAQSEPYVWHRAPGIDLAADDFRWQRDYLVRSAHAREAYWPSRNNWGPLVVPAHAYFVLGDNRDDSRDSRYWGFVPDSLLRGRPLVVYYSYRPDSTSAWSWVTGTRWRRIGTVVR